MNTEHVGTCCNHRKVPTKTAYAGADSRLDLTKWHPVDTAADLEVRCDRRIIKARAKDVARNEPIIAGAIQHQIDAAIGTQLRLKPDPDGIELNWTETQTAAAISSIKRKWRRDTLSKSNWFDVTGHNNLLELAALHTRTYLIRGESFALVSWRQENTAAPFRTVVQIIDPDRVCTPTGMESDETIKDGIQYSEAGYALGYWIADKHPKDPTFRGRRGDWTYRRARNDVGRQLVIHTYNKNTPELSRGVSELASCLKTIKKLEIYTTAEIEKAIVQSMVAATITSDMPNAHEILTVDNQETDSCLQHMQDRKIFHDANTFTFDGAKVPLLFNGEKLNLEYQKGNAADQFEGFSNIMWTNIARCFGLSREILTQDWSKTNYSGARAGMLSMWRRIEALRVEVPGDFLHRVYCAWLEDMIGNGEIAVPKYDDPTTAWLHFQINRDAYTHAQIRGPARDEIDRAKTADAYLAEQELGVFTLDRYCDQVLGEEYEDVIRQQCLEEVRVNEIRAECGLEPLPPGGTDGVINARELLANRQQQGIDNE